MADWLLGAALFVLATVALGAIRVVRGPGAVDRMMGVQLLGSGGVAVLVLVSAATRTPALVDVALTLALVAGFASAALVAHAGERR